VVFRADYGRTPFGAVLDMKKRHRVEPMACWEDRALVDKAFVESGKQWYDFD